MFSDNEQNAIEEKLIQLRNVKQEILSPYDAAFFITQRRVEWIEEHLDNLLEKYDGMKPEEQAYRIIFFDHMRINPDHSKMVRVSPTKIKIKSYNFCPYLEACKQLKLDTRFVCKEIGEPSIHEILKRINPNLRFSRNYKKIRPYNKEFCEEYIEFLKK